MLVEGGGIETENMCPPTVYHQNEEAGRWPDAVGQANSGTKMLKLVRAQGKKDHKQETSSVSMKSSGG